MAKDFRSVAKLQTLAASLPVQRPPEPVPAAQVVAHPARAAKPAAAEATLQISLRLRKSLARQLDRLALDAEQTKRAFILAALRDKGLAVTEEDLADARKQRA